MPQVIPLVVTAITTVTSAVVAAGPLAVAAFNAVNVIGAAALANEAFKALQPEVRQSGTSIEWEANPNAALPFAFGRVGVSGNIIANRVYGPDDMYVGFVSVVSAAGPIKSFVSFKADDTSVSFDASGKAVTSYHANVMWRRTQLGQQPEPSALSSPTGLKNGATMPGWGSAYKLSGKAAYIWTLSENSKRSAYGGRVPTPLNVIEGLYCWDPRLDSTYPGGSGTCRLNDPSTWVWRENPALFALKWALGLWEGPVGKGAPQMGFQVGGIGAKVENIRVDRLVELANIADANGWKAAAWPKADEPKDQVLDSFLQAAGAVYADEQGKISCIQRAAARPSILTITSDDIAGTVEYDTTTSKIGRLNTIRPRFWSAANDWQMAPTDEVSATLWREEDGQGQAVTRSKGIDFNYVPGSKQTRELACLLVAHTREGIRGTVPVRSYVDVEPGDAFDFQVPEATLNGLKCLVLNTEPDLENDTVIVTFASESDGKYAYAYGQADAPPPAPELEPSDPTYVTPPLPGDWTITPRPPAPGGGGLPSFDLTGVVSNSTATAIIVEYGPTAAGPWKQAYQGPPTVTNIPIEGLQPGATYFVAVQYQRNQNYSDRYVYGPYTAPLLDPSPNAPTIQAINADITAAFGDIFDVSALVSQARTDIDAQGAEIAAARGDQGNLSARLSQLNQFRIDGDTALGTSITNLTARTANTEADIIDIENAAANDRTATAQAISQVSARQNLLPNKIRNGDFRSGLANYIQSGAGWIIGTAGGPGAAYAFCGADGQQDLWTDYYPVDTNLSFAFMGSRSGANVSLNLVIEWWSETAQVGFGTVTIVPQGGFQRIIVENDVRPATATRFRILARKLGTGGNVAFTLLKVNTGAYATPWSDDQDAKAVQASVTEQALAIIDLENQNALASWSIKAAATGGKPTILQLLSGTFGSSIALTAEQLYFGDNTVFDDATDTLQTTVGPNIRVLAFGAPFGASGNLLEWWGPSSIAIGSMTTANGLNGRMTTAPYVFDNVVVTVAARFAAGTVTVFRTTSSTTAAQLTSTGTVLVEASVTSTSEDDVTAPIVTADVVGVSSGGVETVLATKSMGSGLPEDPLVHTFAPVQGSYPTYRVKVRGSGPVSKDGQSTVEVTLKTSPVA